MNRNGRNGRESRVSRPFVRSRRSTPSGGAPARLAALAGGPAARASVEALERRQMLFALTVSASDVDPTTGLGTVRGFFGYTIPYIFPTTEVQDQDPTTRVEDFNDEPATVAGTPIGSPRNFAGSALRVIHNIAPAANFTLRGVPDAMGQVTTERFIRANVGAGQFFAFQFFSDPQTFANRLAVSQVSFTVRGVAPSANVGINTDNMRVDLFFNNANVASFTGDALRALSSTNSGLGVFTVNAPPGSPAFDEIRISAFRGPNPSFDLDDLNYVIPAGNFATIVDSRIYGVEAVLTGPVGASARFLDLYNRDIVRTIALGRAGNVQLTLVDLDDDGIPNFNDGIGSIQMSGADFRTALTMFGGTIRPRCRISCSRPTRAAAPVRCAARFTPFPN